MGLTPLRRLTSWWVSLLGMLPGIAVSVYAGAIVPDLQPLSERGVGGLLSPQRIAAFALLGVFPCLVTLDRERFRPNLDSSVSKVYIRRRRHQ